MYVTVKKLSAVRKICQVRSKQIYQALTVKKPTKTALRLRGVPNGSSHVLIGLEG